MKPDHLVEWHCQEAERIVVPEILLGGEREPRQIIERTDAFGGDTGLRKLVTIKRHTLRKAPDTGLQPLDLELLDLRSRGGLNLVPDVGCGALRRSRLAGCVYGVIPPRNRLRSTVGSMLFSECPVDIVGLKMSSGGRVR